MSDVPQNNMCLIQVISHALRSTCPCLLMLNLNEKQTHKAGMRMYGTQFVGTNLVQSNICKAKTPQMFWTSPSLCNLAHLAPRPLLSTSQTLRFEICSSTACSLTATNKHALVCTHLHVLVMICHKTPSPKMSFLCFLERFAGSLLTGLMLLCALRPLQLRVGWLRLVLLPV